MTILSLLLQINHIRVWCLNFLMNLCLFSVLHHGVERNRHLFPHNYSCKHLRMCDPDTKTTCKGTLSHFFCWWLPAHWKKRKVLAHIRRACGDFWKERESIRGSKGTGERDLERSRGALCFKLQTRLKTLEPPELHTWLRGCDVSPPMALTEPYCCYKLRLIAPRHNTTAPGLSATNSQTRSQLPSTYSIAAFCTAHICICLISSFQLK